MADAFGNLSGSGPQQVWLSLNYAGYDQAGNFSYWDWEVRYYGHGYGSWGSGPHSWSLSGFAVGGSGFDIPRSDANLTYKKLGGGRFTKSHDSNGNLATGTLTATITSNHSAIGSGSVGVSTGSIPRIPKPPVAPAGLTASAGTSATSATLAWNAPTNNNGAGVLEYEVHASTSATFATLTTSGKTTTRSVVLGSLIPGTLHYFRVRARNAAGWGGWSTSATRVIGDTPNAPVLVDVAQTADRTLRALWDSPSNDGGSPVTGYRIQHANNAGFAQATTVNVANVNEWVSAANIAPGPRWVRVAAVNVVTGAPGAVVRWSNALTVNVTGDVGDTDGWELRYGVPTGTRAAVGSGLRRSDTGLAVEYLTTAEITPGGFETILRRIFPRLRAGRLHRLEAQVSTGAPAYATTVRINSGDAVALTATPATVAYEFTATQPEHILQFIAQTTVPPGASADAWALNLQITRFRLYEIPAPAPYRLGDTVYEGPLANHFDIACATRGGAWWVDSTDTVRFREYDDLPEPLATFSDEAFPPGALSYTDIDAAYDTRNTVTRAIVDNHGRDAVSGDADDATYIGENAIAQAEWGVREATIDMTMAEPETYMPERLAELLSQSPNPEQMITGIRWNAQDDPELAARIDVQDRIVVQFRGKTQISRVLGITHDITPTRWMIRLDLKKELY